MVSTADGNDAWRLKQSNIGVGPRLPFPGLYNAGWWHEGLGLSLAAGDPDIGEMDVQDHEANWLQVITMIQRLMHDNARPNHSNQMNLELPVWCKDKFLDLARRLGLIAQSSLSTQEARVAMEALAAPRPDDVGSANIGWGS